MLSASSANNHSLFSFGRRNDLSSDVGDSTASFDFLPSVSFDDLQSSLETASTDFKLTQFPSPTSQGSILEDQGGNRPLVDMMVERPNVTHNGGTTRVAIQQPPVTRSRTGSILRRPSTNSRQGTASTLSSAPLNAPTAPAAMRPRRQSHYPPVSNSNIAKPPRQSVGPGLPAAYDSDYETRKAQRRRPSLQSLSDKGAADSTRTSIDGGSRPYPDTSRNLTASRAAKARSVQPPARLNQSTLSTNNAAQTPDPSRLSTAFPRSPRGARVPGQPGSAKRVSAMPGVSHASHATGLGARTISPTDTRRMKRLSSLPPPPGQQTQTPSVPPPPPAETRPASRSPSASMLPRKAPTPSSSRTTPDPNRKSYSSGLSITSINSFNTARTSTGSIQPRMTLAASSRLPAPKALNLHNHNHNSSTMEDDEDVPPVPAIPKVYESPKESPAEMSFLDKRRSTLAFDTSSIHSNSTGSITGPLSTDTSVRVQRKASTRKSMHTSKAEMERKAGAQKRNQQPLRLPPLTLAPLSLPTAAKIAALQEQGASDRNLSPPPSRTTKTPTTPMTASKSSFFSRRQGERPDNSFRSSSSVHHGTRHGSPLAADATSSSESITTDSKTAPLRSGMSPYLSSSVPKGGADHLFLKRHQTNGDYTLPLDGPADLAADSLAAKPSGPRAQKATARTKSPPPLSSPEEPPTPSSISSLRRKLSLGWKRSASKNSISHPTGDKSDIYSVRQDSMPPPRIPASATNHNHSTLSLSSSKPASPTPSIKSTKSTKSNGTNSYLDTRRRKSSASSLNAVMAHDSRHRSDSLAGSKKETGLDTVVERSTISHNSSIVQKILKPKPSTSTMRGGHDIWTADLDKDDLVAEDEMKRLGSRRKETELAARTLDALRKRATPKERVSAPDAIRIAMLNIYERGEIVDYNDVYFCGTQNAAKVVGDLNSDGPNFGYDDERGDYTIIPGDHLAYRYEVIDILGKGSFGQVVRCIDHKTGVLVAIKIIRNKKRFHQQALVEVNILQKLREWVSLPPPFCRLNTNNPSRIPRTSTAWSASRTTSTFVAISASRPSC